MSKSYLGDGVYAEIVDGMIRLTTNPGNRDFEEAIYLNERTWRELVIWEVNQRHVWRDVWREHE